MGLFSKRTPAVQPPTPATRTIPLLYPEYFDSIHTRLIANGGSNSASEIAVGVANAIFNTAGRVLHGSDARDFEELYGHTPRNEHAADRMIDFLITVDAGWQAGEGGWIGTLLGRLDEVLSRPA